MVAKSTAATFVMRAENSCFQDLETSWWRSGKKGSGLRDWAGARLVRKLLSNLDWDPPPNPAPAYPPAQWPLPTARCRTGSCVSHVRQEGEIRMCWPVSPLTPWPQWTKRHHHTSRSRRRLHRRPPGRAVDPRRRKQRAQRGFRWLLAPDWGRASEIEKTPAHHCPTVRVAHIAPTHRLVRRLGNRRSDTAGVGCGGDLGKNIYPFSRKPLSAACAWCRPRHTTLHLQLYLPYISDDSHLRMRKVVPSAFWPIGLAGWYRASDVCHTKECFHSVMSP